MTDQLEELFADLRAETLPTVRPPGTEPLRRAARRRRAAVSATAAVVVLAVAGVIAVIRPGGDPVPPAARKDGPTYSLPTLASKVAEALQIDDPDQPQPGEILPNTWFSEMASSPTMLGGTYEIRMVCYGSGAIKVTVGSGAPPAVTDTLECDTTGTVRAVPITVPEPSGPLTVRVEPDVAGPGRAGFGWTPRLTENDRSRWMETARDALGEETAGYNGRGAVFLDTSGTRFDSPEAEVGRYRVRAACVGFGTVRLTVGPSGEPYGTPAGQATVRCSPTGPEQVSVTYTATEGLYYGVYADGEAQGRAAVAAMLEAY